MSTTECFQTVRDLAVLDRGFGTVSGEMADLIHQEACDDLGMTVAELVDRVPASESHVRDCLKEMPPEAFGL